MMDNINQIQSQISPNDEINPIEVNQSMLSGGFPLLTQQQITPDKNKVNQSDLSSKSSPNCNDKTTNNESSSKILFPNNSSSNTTTKRSPTRAGIMSRFAKSPHRIKYNNVLLNALPINLTPSPTETVDTTKPEVII
jgi:hypothetical protein